MSIGPAPHPVVAVGIVCFRDMDVLLIRRGKPPRTGEWSIPGGRVEFGETLLATAARELREETGIEAQGFAHVETLDGLFTSRTSGVLHSHYVLVDYVARWLSGEPRAGDDATEARFVPLAEIGRMDLWAETRRVIDKAHAMLQRGDAGISGLPA